MSTLRHLKNIVAVAVIITPCYFMACSVPPAKNSTPKAVTAEEKRQTDGDFEHLSEIVPDGFTSVTPIDHSLKTQAVAKAHNSIWQTIDQQFGFPEIEHSAIEKELSILLSHPIILRRNLSTSLPLVEYVFSEVSRRNLPSELALIPFVESGYLLSAKSSRRAQGLWQLMPATASSLGLQKTWWQDDTYNVILSTDAALDYLQSQYARFDDWIYALTAYNWGPARLSRNISKVDTFEDPHPFFSLKLPGETRRYIPKLLAYKKLIMQRQDYAYLFESEHPDTKLTAVHVRRQTSLAVIAELSYLDTAQVKKFNPGYKRWATPPNQHAVLLLPQTAAELIDHKLPALSAKERMPWSLYRIKPGDTLSEIAYRNRISTSTLRKLNALESDRIIAGKLLKIPTL